MAKAKDFDRPDVATYSDHELITPDTRHLRRMVREALPDEENPVARAEAALEQISGEFAGWMREECDRLDRARHQVKTLGLNEQTRQSLFLAAHDLKGGCATFGYPAVTLAADSLCRLLDRTPKAARVPVPLIDQHVDAVRAIVREYARPDILLVASALTDKLRTVTDAFLMDENRHRPDTLEQVIGPSLAPAVF